MKKRILVVDDEASFTSMLKHSLENDGYFEVQEENDATHAMEAAREFDPDLVILDIMMPEIDGSDVAIRFKESSRFANLPIIFMTALVMGNEAPLGSCSRGGQTFLPKTTPVEKLIACIDGKIGKQAPIAVV